MATAEKEIKMLKGLNKHRNLIPNEGLQFQSQQQRRHDNSKHTERIHSIAGLDLMYLGC